MSTQDRRSQGATRIPFEALVEVGGELGPSFEAQAVNISEEGMHLRTAYLPEVGQAITCRFDVGRQSMVQVTGDVVWTQEQGKGGEFGIRFVELDPEAEQALASMMGHGDAAPPPALNGSRVRLHIDGLGSPMRARVKASSLAEVTAFSELGFLQVGKQLELEDTNTGAKRPAHIDRVEVQVDPESHVPQLVVKLRYDDAAAAESSSKEATPEPTVIHDESETKHAIDVDVDAEAPDGANAMRDAFARGAAKVTPAFVEAMKRAKTTLGLLTKRSGSGDLAGPAQRRRTSPPPGGGLHAEGRRVVRGESLADAKAKIEEQAPKLVKINRRVMIGGAVGFAALVALVAMKKPGAPAQANAAAGADSAAIANAQAPATTTTAEAPNTAPPSVLSPTGTSPSSPLPASTANASLASAPSSTLASEMDETDESNGEHHPRRKLHVAPFSNGPVPHGNVLRLKMDGAIEKIEGAPQATGFTVVVPERRSLEAAGPLAARDGRIASIRVSNDNSGAELNVAFKDGVPNYVVRARGDVLEIVLAAPGNLTPEPKPTIRTIKHDVANVVPRHIVKHPQIQR